MGGALSPRLRRLEEPAAVAVASLCLLLLVLLPLLWLLAQLVTSGAPEQLATLLGSARLWTLLGRSLALASAITCVALALGVPLGALLARTNVVGRGLALWLHVFPFLLPPFLIALGWFRLFGRDAPLGSEWSAHLLFSSAGVVALLGLVFSPVVTALTALGLHGVDASLEEAARVVAPPARVMTRVLLPLAWPAIALAALVVFALALSELGVPLFLNVETYPAAVFSRLAGARYAPGEAFALVLPLLVVALLLLGLERRFIGRRSFAFHGARGRRPGVLPLGRWRALVSVGVWLLVACGLLPVLVLLRQGWGGGFTALEQWMGGSPLQSLLVGALAASVITALGLVLGTRLARGRRGSASLDALSMLAFIMPAAVLGVGLIATFHHRATHFVYGTTLMLVVGLVARYSILGVRTFAASVSQSPPELEQAAAVAGAGYVRRMLRIVAPMHARGLGAAWLLSMVFALRDLDMVVLFYPPGRETLPIRIFTLEANGSAAVIAALASLHIALTAGVLAVGGAALWRRSRT